MRSLPTFLSRLSTAAGHDVSERVVGRVLRAFFPERGEWSAELKPNEVAQLVSRLGLTLREVDRPGDDLPLPRPGQPTLLQREGVDGRKTLGFVAHGDGESVRVTELGSTGVASHTVAVADLSRHLEASGSVVTAWRVEAMGASTTGAAAHRRPATPLAKLWYLLAPDRFELWMVFGFAVSVGILALATPVAVQSLVNYVAFGGLLQPLVVLGLLLLVFLALSGAIRAFKTYLVEMLQRRLFVRVVSDMSVRLPQVRMEALDSVNGPSFVNRYFDVMTVQKAGASVLLDGLDVLLQAAVGLIVLGFYHPYLMYFDLILIAILVIIIRVVGRGAVGTALAESSAKYAVAAALEEVMSSPASYKLAGAPEFARARLASMASDYIGKRKRHFGIVFRQILATIALYAVASTALLTLGGWLVIRGELTLGQLIASELIVSIALAALVKFGTKLQSYYDLLAGASKLHDLYEIPIEDDLGEPYAVARGGASIELRSVVYSFPRSSSCHHFSLRVESGDKVAIRGSVGAGKSLMADLLCGLRDSGGGAVLLDGLDVRGIANDSMRREVELIRGLEIVKGTILENMRLGRSSIGIELATRVLERLGVLDAVQRLPDGLLTELSEHGAPLSRGTAQMIMLARAVADEPSVIVVDSVLDELDDEARRSALQVLAGADAPWTLVVMTRRSDPDPIFDRIVDLEGPTGVHRVDGAMSRRVTSGEAV